MCFKAPLPSMVFQWFYHPWTITIECFCKDQPLKSMVFQWFSQIQVQWWSMVLTLKKTNKLAWLWQTTVHIREDLVDKVDNTDNTISKLEKALGSL